MKICIIDDDLALCDCFEGLMDLIILEHNPFLEYEINSHNGKDSLPNKRFDLIICDLVLNRHDQLSGIEIISHFLNLKKAGCAILMSASWDVYEAAEVLNIEYPNQVFGCYKTNLDEFKELIKKFLLQF